VARRRPGYAARVTRPPPVPAVPALLAVLALGAAGGACTRTEQRESDIQDEVAIIAGRDDVLVDHAIQRLRRYGHAALPPIEAALPKASPTGRLNLVMALRRLGDPEAIPLLKHLALRNEVDVVRLEAEVTLRTWARGADQRAARARAAVRQIEERQGRGQTG